MDSLINVCDRGRGWAKFVGIMSVIFFIISVFKIFTTGLFAGLFSIIIAIFANLLPGLFMIRYANAIANAKNSNNPAEELEIACLNQGRYFLLLGIMAILGIIAFVLIFGGMILAAASRL